MKLPKSARRTTARQALANLTVISSVKTYSATWAVIGRTGSTSTTRRCSPSSAILHEGCRASPAATFLSLPTSWPLRFFLGPERGLSGCTTGTCESVFRGTVLAFRHFIAGASSGQWHGVRQKHLLPDDCPRRTSSPNGWPDRHCRRAGPAGRRGSNGRSARAVPRRARRTTNLCYFAPTGTNISGARSVCRDVGMRQRRRRTGLPRPARR